jgi:hypothetical protein
VAARAADLLEQLGPLLDLVGDLAAACEEVVEQVVLLEIDDAGRNLVGDAVAVAVL